MDYFDDIKYNSRQNGKEHFSNILLKNVQYSQAEKAEFVTSVIPPDYQNDVSLEGIILFRDWDTDKY